MFEMNSDVHCPDDKCQNKYVGRYMQVACLQACSSKCKQAERCRADMPRNLDSLHTPEPEFPGQSNLLQTCEAYLA